ncbi:TlpA family protein disulfide reductase [Streptomyces albogriseolus]|uniref:TlpA family protein disulfide reductase n=1 Tax=Streptomyces albogriseolus TaxID=1887 RepID=UPI003700DB19
MMITRSPRAAGITRRTALLAVPLAALVTSGCAGGDTDPPSDPAAPQQLLAVPAADRKPAPDVRGETLTGETVALADHRGQVVVLNVWGSWCTPCRAEAPHLQKVHQDTKDQNVAFLGINTRDSTQTNARNFEKDYGITYPSLWDPDGRQLLKFKGTVSPSAIPSTIVIDREGRIAARALKALGEAELRELLAPVLKEG